MNSFSKWLALASLGLVVACDNNSPDDNNQSNGPTPGPNPEPVSLQQETIDLPSAARPPQTPGSDGVLVTNEKLLAQFGGSEFDLNRARYTRYFLSNQADNQPQAIVVLIPGFFGGAAEFRALAENVMRRAQAEQSLSIEVWAIDRRSNQLEDTAGLDIAEELQDPLVGLDFLFGEQLGLPLSQPLEESVNRRAVYYNGTSDTAFMANWTYLVHTLDIDAVVERALETVENNNVFLGGHSAGTGYTARYAATDFNFSGGDPIPGFEKVRGLILLEGGGASNADTAPTEAELDLIEARFDGALFAAVRDQIPYCADAITTCSVETAALDCADLANQQCVEPTSAFSSLNGLLPPQISAASEVTALDADLNGDGVLSILQQEIDGVPGNSAIQQVPELASLAVLLGSGASSSLNLLGQFLDDDGIVADLAGFLATSHGFPGPEVDGVRTWLNGDEVPPEALPDNGFPPETLEEVGLWGQELEPTDLPGQIVPAFYQGGTNFVDWYYPSSGLGVTSGLGLDTSALSSPPPLGRGRTDIDNRTQGGAIDIPVIAFGGSNGLTPTPSSWLAFAQLISMCTAPACDGVTPRLVSADTPNTAFPTYGEISGGFEVHMTEGYSHVDIVTAVDDGTNNVIAPLVAFIVRHLQ
ncbi:MAG: hypothetical protein AAF699_18920 [Pseudomonadota bacterium]